MSGQGADFTAADGGPRGALHATLREVEDGVFRAEYHAEMNPERPHEAREIPDFHVGTDRDAVRLWVEQMAPGMGYSGVVWHDA